MKSLRREYLQGGSDCYGERPEKRYKTTTQVAAEKLEKGSKNGKVTP